MGIRYRCLILDHDDTAVRSTPDLHYPSFVEALKTLRPGLKPLSLEEFVLACFNPGFGGLCRDIMKFTMQEQEYQYSIWRKYTERIVSDFYPGFVEMLAEYKKRGGLITVVSHSEQEYIERDYRVKAGFVPDLIFGWDTEEDKRKPHPYPVLEILKRLNLNAAETLLLDDLKPGMVMARNCNVQFAAAGWSHNIEEIKDFMRINSEYYFPTVESFKDFILTAG